MLKCHVVDLLTMASNIYGKLNFVRKTIGSRYHNGRFQQMSLTRYDRIIGREFLNVPNLIHRIGCFELETKSQLGQIDPLFIYIFFRVWKRYFMGIVTMGIPQEIVIELARIGEAKAFVETGTYKGTTTRWAAQHFETVHTIERAKNLFKECSDELAKIKGVTPHFGDSKDILPEIVKMLPDQVAVHWLDGHWSGGPTAGEGDECPILEELASLANRPNDLILIDDARLFLCTPPLPHRADQWPTMGEIVSALPLGDQQPYIQVVDDVIFIIPNKPALKKCLSEYCQKRSKVFWNQFTALQRREQSVSRRIISKVKRRFSS